MGNLTEETDWNGTATRRAYDNLNRLTATTEGYGTTIARTRAYGYDAVSNLISRMDAKGSTTTLAYNPLHQYVATVQAVGTGIERTFQSIVDAMGNAVGSIDAVGAATTTALDMNYAPIFRTDAIGHFTELRRDAIGRVESVVDGRFNPTGYQHDRLDRMIATVDAHEESTGATFDDIGKVLTFTDRRGHITAFAFDHGEGFQLNRPTNLGRRACRYDAIDSLPGTGVVLGIGKRLRDDGICVPPLDGVGSVTSRIDAIGPHVDCALCWAEGGIFVLGYGHNEYFVGPDGTVQSFYFGRLQLRVGLDVSSQVCIVPAQ